MKKIPAALLAALIIISAFSLTSCGKEEQGAANAPVNYHSLDELAGKCIGVLAGTICDTVAAEKIPDIKVEYLNSHAELAAALEAGKIDAFTIDEPVSVLIKKEHPNIGVIGKLMDDSYAFVFPKGNDELCGKMNEFLAKLRADGTLDEIKELWLGDDTEHQTVDLSGLSGENGVLLFCTATDCGEPFAYVKDGVCVGYDIDLAVRFCREYGYGIEISDAAFAGLMAGISAGKYDFGASCISITEERKKSMLMSDPSYIGGLVMATLTDRTKPVYKKTGVLTGSVFDAVTAEYFPDSEVYYYDSNADMAAALANGKVDSYCCDEPIARKLISKYPEQRISEHLRAESYGFALAKDSERARRLCSEFNEFLARIKADGTLDEIDDKWLGSDDDAMDIDYGALTGENGTVTLCVNLTAGEPFDYYKEGHYVGYDVDLIYRFCLDRGYGLVINDVQPTAMLTAVMSGKADFAASFLTITEERKESVLFTDPYCEGGSVMVVSDARKASDKKSFFESVADNFEKTFIKEDRWKLYVSGLMTTLLITVLSAILGTLLGFAVYMLYRQNNRAVNAFTDAVISVLVKMPVVVILMVLFYVIFGKSDIDGVWVSVMAFTVLFASSVTGLLKTGVSAVDAGQTEAALALGYTPAQSFFRIVLPQALRYVLPGYKDSVISLIKDTAIVGYISVQDLTKVSDIVRSRTYEAFFSIISTAVIYFAAASLLALIVELIGRKADNRRRSRRKILSGVKTK